MTKTQVAIVAVAMLAASNANAFNLFDLGQVEGLGKVGESIRAVSSTMQVLGVQMRTPDAGGINRTQGVIRNMEPAPRSIQDVPRAVRDWQNLGQHINGLFR